MLYEFFKSNSLIALSFVTMLLFSCLFLFLATRLRSLSYFAKPDFTELDLFALSYIIFGIVAYVVFWMAVLLPWTSRWVSTITLIFAVFQLHRVRDFLAIRTMTTQMLGVIFAASLFYFSVLEFYQFLPTWPGAAAYRFLAITGEDNQIPLQFATLLREGLSLREVVPGWLTGDRTPLAAGFSVWLSPNSNGTWYQALQTWLQMFWIPSFIYFLISLKFSKRNILAFVSLLLLCGFTVYHATYVWSKIMAANYFFLGLAFYARYFQSRNVVFIGASGVAIFLGFLCHAGVLLAAPSLLLFMVTREKWSKKVLLPCLSVLGILIFGLVTWKLYVHFYSGPGDRLLKMHLAGVMGVDDRSLVQSIREAYKDLTFAEWLDVRVENFHSIYAWPAKSIEGIRNADFFLIVNTIGVLWIGFFVYMKGLFVKLRDGLPLNQDQREIGLLWLFNVVNFFGWIIIAYNRGGMTVHQASYGMIFIFLFCCIYEISKYKWIFWTCLAVEATYFVLEFLSAPYEQRALGAEIPINLFAVLALLLSIGLLVPPLRRLQREFQ